MKACGLDDFGVDDDNYREALTVLLSRSAGRRPDRTRQQDEPVLRAQRTGGPAGVGGGVEAVPAACRCAVERPIFVTGLPRTGTTVIHRLLTADPRHQGLELRLAEFPQPRPPRETGSENPFRSARARFAKAHAEDPDYPVCTT